MTRAHWLAATTIFIVVAAALAIAYGPLGSYLEWHVAQWQHVVSQMIKHPTQLAGWRLYLFAFLGGLVASLSPCILGMLPANLSYIGASRLTTRRAAVITASTFVLGVIIVNTIFGLVSSVFFAVLVEYRAWMSIAVGIIYVMMGLWMAGILPLPVSNIVTRIPTGVGLLASMQN
jgi:cytochrome c-type biogenesis protein